MDLEFLKDVLSVTTVTGYEDNMVEFITNFGIKHGITVIQDVYGNIYLKKGVLDEGENYPVVVAHMDTVHVNQSQHIEENLKLIIEDHKYEGEDVLIASDPVTGMLTGIGGDDKAGVAIALSIILETDKIIGAFFREEETGCWGSKNLDKEVLKDAGFVIQFDAPGANWVSFNCWGTQLFNREFYLELKDLFNEYNVNNFSSDPYTDVYQMRQQLNINCINMFAGYERMHTSLEYVITKNVIKAFNLGLDMVKKLGNKKYEFIYDGKSVPLNEVIYEEMVN